MKRLLLSTVALVGFAGIASAADLPRRVAPPVVAPYVPAFTWTGFYFGVNAGAAFQTEDDEDNFFGDDHGRFRGDTIRINRGDIRGSQRSAGTLRLRNGGGNGDGLFDDDDGSDVGFTGGGQIGFNYQFTPGSGFVVGLEADIQYIDLGDGNGGGGGRSTAVSPGDFDADRKVFNGQGVGNLAAGNSFGAAFDPRPGQRPATRVVRGGGLSSQSIDAFGTVRGRVGFAFDRTLIYATGGFAYGFGGGNDNNDELFDNGGVFNDNDNDDFKFGYAVGGGVEFALSSFQLFGSSTATFKIEGLYVNLSEDDNNDNNRVQRASYSRVTRTLRLPSGGGNNSNDELEFAVVRAGINFKF